LNVHAPFLPIYQNIFRGLKCEYETPSTPLPDSVIIFTRTFKVNDVKAKKYGQQC